MGIEQAPFAARFDTDPLQNEVTNALDDLIRTMGTASIALSPTNPSLTENKPPPRRFITTMLGRKLCLPSEEACITAETWARQPPRTQAVIYDSIAYSSIGKYYPDLAVPPTFFGGRPNVRFVPPALRYYRKTALLADMPALRYILANGIDTEPITNAVQAAAIIHDIQHNFPDNATHEDKARILGDVYQNLLTNLELHRIAADPEGTVARFTNTPNEDMQPLGVPVPSNKLPFLGLLHPTIREEYQGRWMTWWHRQDIDPDDNTSHNLFGRQRITFTLADLEKNHLITIDLACEAAIVAIRNDTDATMAA